MFILVLREDASSPLQLVGTGFAVNTPSKTIGMTTAHCIWCRGEDGLDHRRKGDIFFVSNIERDEETDELFIPLGNGYPSVLCYKMKPIYHNTRDICLLQIENDPLNTGTTFPETIPICPTELMPKSSMEEYEVKVYHHSICIDRLTSIGY